MTPERRVLVVYDDASLNAEIKFLVKPDQPRVSVAGSVSEAIRLAQRDRFDVIVVEFHIATLAGTELLRALNSSALNRSALVFVSRFTVGTDIFSAIGLSGPGAPPDPTAAPAVPRAGPTYTRNDGHAYEPEAAHRLTTPGSFTPRSVVQRWVRHVLRGCEAEGDLKTIEDWARCAGVSYTSLCESCRLLAIRPRDARDFVRTLRALIIAHAEGCSPDVLLDVSDRRTLATLLRRAGAGFTRFERSTPIEQFLLSQQFVSQENIGLRALRRWYVTGSL